MKRTDHILALTAAILESANSNNTALPGSANNSANAASDSAKDNANAAAKSANRNNTAVPGSASSLSAVTRVMEDSYSTIEMRKPGAVSVGVSDGRNEFTFQAWISKLQVEKLQYFRYTAYQFNDERLPAHIAAGFAGPSDLVLEITTAVAVSTYVMRVFHSPATDLTTKDFIFLLNSQPDPVLVWSRAAALILESNKLNQRTVFPEGDAAGYLTTEEGQSVFAYLADNLVSEIQIEATVSGNAFVIPLSLKEHFIKYEPALLYAGDGREYVYLYPEREVDAAELLALVDAQPFAGKTWEQLNKILGEYADPDLPIRPEKEWRVFLETLDPAGLQRFVSPVCRSLCVLCEEAGLKPVIPPQLAAAFGPDEMNQKRAAARSKSSGQWQLQKTSLPWEHYQLLQVENIPSSAGSDLSTALHEFTGSLRETQAFAASIGSVFEEAFGLAHFVLTSEPAADNFDEAGLEALAGKAKQAGFSERAVTNLRNACWVATQFSSFGWDTNRAKGLLAINLADVFGGMGSWNDEYVENDQDTYHRLSGELYSGMRTYFAGILSLPR